MSLVSHCHCEKLAMKPLGSVVDIPLMWFSCCGTRSSSTMASFFWSAHSSNSVKCSKGYSWKWLRWMVNSFMNHLRMNGDLFLGICPSLGPLLHGLFWYSSSGFALIQEVGWQAPLFYLQPFVCMHAKSFSACLLNFSQEWLKGF